MFFFISQISYKKHRTNGGIIDCYCTYSQSSERQHFQRENLEWQVNTIAAASACQFTSSEPWKNHLQPSTPQSLQQSCMWLVSLSIERICNSNSLDINIYMLSSPWNNGHQLSSIGIDDDVILNPDPSCSPVGINPILHNEPEPQKKSIKYIDTQV